MHDELFDAGPAENRCAVILAGGDGLRLRSFVQKLRGDWLPKQYVKFLGDRSLLEATLQRARTLISSKRQFVVVTESHFDYAEVPQQLSNYPEVHVAAQPMNRDTGLGLLLALAHIYHVRPDSTVVVFPSDHFIQEEDLFLNHVDAAFGLVERDSERIVLLGIAPTQAETDYGYILPSDRWHNAFPFGAREVKHFIEKPDPILARKLVLRGGFWNTMVMVFNLKMLIEHLRAINPFAYRGFEQICDSMDSAGFAVRVKQIFAKSEPLNLAKGVLEHLAAQRPRFLFVLPVRGVHWSDWGSEERIMSTAGHALNGRLGRKSSSHPFSARLERRAAGTA